MSGGASLKRGALVAYKHFPKWLQGRVDPVSGRFTEFTAGERANRRAYIRAGIKQLRRFAHGFAASDGYDLRELDKLHPARVAKILKLTPYINELRASPHLEVTAHSRKVARALQQRTKQETIPRQKRYVVHVPDPEHTRVKIERGVVTTVRQVRGAEITEKVFALPETAVSFDHIADMLEDELLAEMPKRGHFLVETETHGPVKIMAPIPHNRLVREMRSEWTRYDYGDMRFDPHQSKHFAESITGFRMVATTEAGSDVAARRLQTQRAAYLAHHREIKRREFSRSVRLMGRRGRIK